MSVSVATVDFAGWPNCRQITNGSIDLIVTADVGPRILCCRFSHSGINHFKIYEDQCGLTGGDDWRIYGGHRLWHAPERRPWTYAPDNTRVEVDDDANLDGSITFRSPAHALTGLERRLMVRLEHDAPAATITHEIINRGSQPAELALWALTVLAPGGVARIPLPPRGIHDANLLPSATLSLWAYTDLRDPRFTIVDGAILVRQDSAVATPFKIGLGRLGDEDASPAWLDYARPEIGETFRKRAQGSGGAGVSAGAAYPDGGAQVEVFTNADMLELETLGPMVTLEPGDAAEHIEEWRLERTT